MPDVSVRAVWHTMLLPIVTVPPPVIKNVAILFVVFIVVWFKKSVPSAPVAPTVMFEDALPVKHSVALMPDTVPLSVSVRAPIVSLFPDPVNISAPVIVGFPLIVYAVALAQFSSRFPNVAVEFDMLFAVPVMLIIPPGLLTCVPAPVIFPEQVMMLPPSLSVPAVSARFPLTVQPIPDNETPLALFIVRLPNVVAADPPIVCAALPLKVVVPVEVKAAALTLLVKFPPIFIVLAAAAQLPDERVTLPATVQVAL